MMEHRHNKRVGAVCCVLCAVRCAVQCSAWVVVEVMIVGFGLVMLSVLR